MSDQIGRRSPMSDLRDQIAAALTTWTNEAAGNGALTVPLPRDQEIVHANSVARADAVMPLIQAEIDRRDAEIAREAREQVASELRLDAEAHRRLDQRRPGNPSIIARARTLETAANRIAKGSMEHLDELLERIRTAEAERDELRTAVARFRGYLDTNFRNWCSPHAVAAQYATSLIGHLDACLADDGGVPL